MTCDVVVMTAETDVAEVARSMLGQRLRAIPIVQHDPAGTGWWASSPAAT
jgi:CBS domain-containing protein